MERLAQDVAHMAAERAPRRDAQMLQRSCGLACVQSMLRPYAEQKFNTYIFFSILRRWGRFLTFDIFGYPQFIFLYCSANLSKRARVRTQPVSQSGAIHLRRVGPRSVPWQGVSDSGLLFPSRSFCRHCLSLSLMYFWLSLMQIFLRKISASKTQLVVSS